MKQGLEYYIIQNSALGSLALWSFATKYYENTHQQKGVPLPLTMIVLPMVFHKETVSSISRRRYKGGLYRSIGENRTISVGLQQRMESMADQTFMSLNVAFAAGLLKYDPETAQVIPGRTAKPSQVKIGETKEIMDASGRLGHWFSQISVEQLSVLLKVRF